MLGMELDLWLKWSWGYAWNGVGLMVEMELGVCLEWSWTYG